MNTENVIKILTVIGVIISGISECLRQYNKATENANKVK